MGWRIIFPSLTLFAMGSEQSVAKTIASAKKRQDTSLVFRGEVIDPKWIPQDIQSLKLEIIKLMDVPLTVVPSPVFAMATLKQLDLSNDQLVSITGIGALANLTDLNVSGNRLDYLPEDFANLKNLKFLNVSNNILTIRSLPVAMLEWKSLMSLDISENRFVKLTTSLADLLSATESITIHSNPWEHAELLKLSADSTEEQSKALVKEILGKSPASAASSAKATSNNRNSYNKGHQEQNASHANNAEIKTKDVAHADDHHHSKKHPKEAPAAPTEDQHSKKPVQPAKEEMPHKQEEPDSRNQTLKRQAPPIPADATPARSTDHHAEPPSKPAVLSPAASQISAAQLISSHTATSLPSTTHSPAPSATPNQSSAQKPSSPQTAPPISKSPAALIATAAPQRTSAYLKPASRVAGPKGRKAPTAEFIDKAASEGDAIVITFDGKTELKVSSLVVPVEGPPPAVPSKGSKPDRTSNISTKSEETSKPTIKNLTEITEEKADKSVTERKKSLGGFNLFGGIGDSSSLKHRKTLDSNSSPPVLEEKVSKEEPQSSQTTQNDVKDKIKQLGQNDRPRSNTLTEKGKEPSQTDLEPAAEEAGSKPKKPVGGFALFGVHSHTTSNDLKKHDGQASADTKKNNEQIDQSPKKSEPTKKPEAPTIAKKPENPSAVTEPAKESPAPPAKKNVSSHSSSPSGKFDPEPSQPVPGKKPPPGGVSMFGGPISAPVNPVKKDDPVEVAATSPHHQSQKSESEPSHIIPGKKPPPGGVSMFGGPVTTAAASIKKEEAVEPKNSPQLPRKVPVGGISIFGGGAPGHQKTQSPGKEAASSISSPTEETTDSSLTASELREKLKQQLSTNQMQMDAASPSKPGPPGKPPKPSEKPADLKTPPIVAPKPNVEQNIPAWKVELMKRQQQ